jgi:hypothetical protein
LRLARGLIVVADPSQADGTLKLIKLVDDRLGISQHGLCRWERHPEAPRAPQPAKPCSAFLLAAPHRTLVNNMVVGVSSGFEKRMEMVRAVFTGGAAAGTA